jgi:hypothetical protein
MNENIKIIINNMEEYSDCCGAGRHHIYDELCGDCLEHCEFTDWDGEDEDFEYIPDIEDLQS